jgi:hypothetical protein
MNTTKFINMLKALYFIDRSALPELSVAEWTEFRVDPPRYLMQCEARQQYAIMKEINKRV